MQIAHLWECIRNHEYLSYLKYYTISMVKISDDDNINVTCPK